MSPNQTQFKCFAELKRLYGLKHGQAGEYRSTSELSEETSELIMIEKDIAKEV